MPYDELHLSDRDLVLAADGELPPARAASVQAHLEACPQCRARRLGFEDALSSYFDLQRDSAPVLPPAAVPRARLQARLHESHAPLGTWHTFPAPWRWALAAGFVVVFFAGAALYRTSLARLSSPVPLAHLTPGEVRPVALDDVCRLPSDGRVPAIPAAVRQLVFREYGIRNARPDSYEVDYLITPELGGADSIRNLWPQPYSAEWNAHVKDRLEDRLHDLVCRRQLDLATAQREIATDWISAYKKYFATNRPN